MTGNQVLCIVGLPRSGTSLIANAVRMSGVYWGEDKDFLPAREDMNREGFYEHLEIADFHYKLTTEGLNRYGWFYTKPLPENWWQDETVASYKQNLRKIIEKNFAESPAWGWKDPCGSPLLPLWLDVLQEMGMATRVIIPFRNPLDVANSMARLWRIPPDQSLRLWLYYMLSIKDSVRGIPHLFVHYDSFLEDPQAGAKALFDFIGKGARLEMLDEIPKLVLPGMRHSHSDMETLRQVVDPSIVALFEECLGETTGESGLIRTLDDYRQISHLADFSRADYASQSINSTLFCDYGNGTENPVDYIPQPIPFADEGWFDQTYVFPKPGPKRILFNICDKGFHCRSRIDARVDDLPCGIRGSNAASKANGWDFFNPDVQPTYELSGNFSNATQIRIRGQIDIRPARVGTLKKYPMPPSPKG
jgi:hypothetical protein